jgi:hypothetical protein
MVFGIYGAFFGFCFLAVVFNLAANRAGVRPRLLTAVNSLFALLAVPCMLLVSEPTEWLSDFRKAYYVAGQLVLEDPCAMYGADELRFVNLPILALPFAPLAGLPLRPAKGVFTLVGLATVIASWALLVRITRAGGWRRTAVAALFVLYGPLYYSVRQGNLTHFLLPLLVVALICLERRRDTWLGVLVAVAGLVKPPLLLLAGYLVWKRRWRAAAACAAVLVLTAGASLALFGAGVHRVWFDRCIGPYSARPLSAGNAQSASAFLARVLTSGDLEDWKPVDVGGSFKALHLLLVAVLAGVPWLASRRPPGRNRVGAERLEFCAALCLAFLISPVSWTHYYLLLLIPFALYLAGDLPLPAGRGWAVAFLLALGLTAPPVLIVPDGNWGVRLLASHCFAGGALLLVTLSAARWRLFPPTADAAVRESPAEGRRKVA